MQTRAFNSISVDIEKSIITKSSNNKEKLEDEILYYLRLPEQLKNLFPKLINFKKDYSAYHLEYLPYSSLQDLILNEKITSIEGQAILSNLSTILQEIHSFKPDFLISSDEIAQFYIKKMKDRILELNKVNYFKTLLVQPILTINGNPYKNFSILETACNKLFIRFTKKYHKVRAIHGDFCFSNILYAPKKKFIKLIDPRGSFTHKGIFGHELYDYAKLMHCLHGYYDFLVNDQFVLSETLSNQFNFEIPYSSLIAELEDSYINLLLNKEIPLDFIYLIEASLFLSMASLHYENLERQKILYLTGIIILNNVIEGKYENMH
ncbi:MAG: hypothetical protein H0U70_05870 [Tatlockia sp.]|nr:hypothetical protein [Tatlockia sp.]